MDRKMSNIRVTNSIQLVVKPYFEVCQAIVLLEAHQG